MAARIVVPGVGGAALPLLPRQRRPSPWSSSTSWSALGKPRVVFSSSASLYATVDGFEVTEESPLDPPSPYARTKQMIEQMLAGHGRGHRPARGDPALLQPDRLRPRPRVRRLRPRALPRARPADAGRTGQRDAFTITGTDHPTRDGTGIRDYLHVWDLAQAHVAAVERFDAVLERGRRAEHGDQPRHRRGGHRPSSCSPPSRRCSAGRCRRVDAPPGPATPSAPSPTSTRPATLLGWTARLSLADGIESALAWNARRRTSTASGLLGYEPRARVVEPRRTPASSPPRLGP